ncbi:cyclic AMP response element-binding protein A-like [Drosophila sulfurigaster albostrigata]|uniref:cyclic AMP response element-binding protein A-like n=1 Tax=Drosophila sulfurigaster albostrigata TaxID=89887 RepID=UPI002D21E632|nr:cyclic AMP response element-binding protein A-like [Drosophila sulfurigaster albostrigata]
MTSATQGSISPDICSDIEIDEAVIKDEPMSPDSSCPASPNSQNSSAHQLSINLANLQTELLFDQKHGGLLLTASSNNLIKSQQQQQLLLGQSSQSQSSLMVPKIAIKSEKQSAASNNSSSGKSHAYGIPLTPPSSLPSDDSEGNLSPEHLYAPLSPNASAVSISAVTNAAANANSADSANNGSARRADSALARAAASSSNGASNNAATSTRQPIHTPLISSQPLISSR